MAHGFLLPNLIAVALLVTACAPGRPMQLPDVTSGGVMVPEEGDVLIDLTKSCAVPLPMSARLLIEGTIHGTPVRRALWVGTDTHHLRIEASPLDGAPFALSGAGTPAPGGARLWLPREQRYAETPDIRDVTGVALGLPLNGQELQSLLTTCPYFSGGGAEPYRVGPNTLFFWSDEHGTIIHEIVLVRRAASSPWRLHSVSFSRKGWPRWRAVFASEVGEIPKTFWISRLDWTGAATPDFDVRVTLDQVRVGAGITGDSLTVPQPSLGAPVNFSDITSTSGGRPLIVQ
jgi:hypothetical protein